MTARDAIARLGNCLTQDSSGRYSFACKKAFVTLKLRGMKKRVRFRARDRVAFRTGADCLTVERSDTGIVWRRFPWEQIEMLTAGEPEIDNGPLFQG